MIRVLHVVGRLDIGGAESRIMDLYRNSNPEEIQFDFMQHTTDRCAFEAEVEELGGHVYHVPRFRITNLLSYRKAWKEFFKEHPEIDVVHGHMTSTAAIYLPIGKKIAKAHTIAHARSAGVDPGIKGKITQFLRKNLAEKCDQCFACSKLAGEAVFGKKAWQEGKVKYIPNAIEVEQFAYDVKKREEIRYNLMIQDKFVVGHVGRFSPVKNHEYLLDVLEALVENNKKNPSQERKEVVLLLVGDGPLREEIMEKTAARGLSAQVLFVGNQKNVWEYYQAMDCFLLPSFYEGLPGTAVEAQCSGLPCILSDTITNEAAVTELVSYKSIKSSPKEWANCIMTVEVNARRSYVEEVRAAEFDVKLQAVELMCYYKERT